MGQKLELIINAVGDAVAQRWIGGKGTFTVVIGSATGINLEYLADDGSTWIAAGADTNLTANGIGNFELAEGQLRAQLVGTATGAYATVVGNGR